MRSTPPPAGLPLPAAQPPPSPPLAAAAEQQLLDFARRSGRQPPMLALVLYLSRLRPPAPRPHHRRIARAMLHEVTQRYGGQVLSLACGDLVLLCPQPPEPPRASGEADEAPGAALDATSPYELPAFLARLLRVDAPEPERLVSLWPIPKLGAKLLAYATARANEGSAAVADGERAAALPARPAAARVTPDRAGQTTMLDALAVAAHAAEISGVLRRQTAVLLSATAAERGRLQPLFREVSFSIAALEAQIGGGVPARADPYLFAHLAARLDQRMLETLAAAAGTGGALDMQGAAALPLHVNLALSSVASPGFARLAAACGSTQDRSGIEVSLMEACADPAGFAAARARVQAAGMLLVLDRVSHLALSLAQIWPLQPDLVKLEWAPAMARLDAEDGDRLEQALGRIGTQRVLLLRADTEAAVRWGMAHGIRRFQGRHVDAMLAASRLAACSHATACTLRQCTERADAASEAGRRHCRNLRLLDAAVPASAASGPSAGSRAREVA